MVDLKNLTIRKAHSAMVKKEFTPLDLVREYKKVIAKHNPTTHAFLEVFEDAEEQAESAGKLYEDGKATILSGIPIALKDNIVVAGKTASAGSKILEHFVSPYDSTVVSKLKLVGAIILGRTNMDEFAMGSSTENSAYGVTRNPHDGSRVPGGSSGGSAVAVAQGATLVALGSDTGGSVRQPASFCGCVGLKPTYGAVSRHGLIALGSSLDQIGPITRSVDDSEILFDLLRGTDPFDSTSFYPKEKPKTPAGLRIGVPRHLLETGGLDKDVLKNFNESIEKFKSLGYEVVDVTLPNAKYALSVYYVIMPAEASSNLSRFDGVKYGFHRSGENLLDDYLLSRGEGFGKEVRRRVILGTYVLSTGYYDAYYNKANAVRSLIRSDYDKAFKSVDLILTPTTPTPAFKIGEKVDDPLAMYLADIFTVPANISGNPAISVPSGLVEVSKDIHLPLGIQLVAGHFREVDLFKAGKDYLGEK
jgi:aspartyl-tRNA(Asn)/glutamyl-tRNA(Gln) amidotransferase subunit A